MPLPQELKAATGVMSQLSRDMPASVRQQIARAIRMAIDASARAPQIVSPSQPVMRQAERSVQQAISAAANAPRLVGVSPAVRQQVRKAVRSAVAASRKAPSIRHYTPGQTPR
jgi:hypothetical protein